MSNRIFYAVQSANFFGKTKGIQSVSVNASVDFEQAFQLGTLQICANLEGVPNVEISTERAFQGATNSFWKAAGGNTASVSTFTGNVNMALADDTSTNFGSQTPFVKATGMFLSSWGVTFPVDGFATETCTAVGNDLSWSTGTGTVDLANAACTGAVFKRRQDVALVTKAQSVSFSCDVGREDLFQLGQKSPYARPATFPVECSSDWEYLASVGTSGLTFVSTNPADVTTSQTLSYEGVTVTGARLTSTNYSGGDAGGGNATITYSYIAYNSLTT